MHGFIRGCGRALFAGGALVILINVIVTPMAHLGDPSATFMPTRVFLIRQSASAVAALLLLFGCLGVHFAQRAVSGAFGSFAFLVSFTGCSLVLAVEWANAFVLRAVAQLSPDTITALDKNVLMSAAFGSAAGLFALGWLLLSVSVWRAGVLPRWAALATLAGLLLIPALGASPLGVNGAIVGNVVFGAGLMGMGAALARVAEQRADKQSLPR
jgi:hypothetical protein